jgi:hypothetical protein
LKNVYFQQNDNTNEIINFGKSGPSSQRLPEIRVKKILIKKINTVGAAECDHFESDYF